MDLPSSRDKGNYWTHQHDVSQTAKPHAKSNASQFVESPSRPSRPEKCFERALDVSYYTNNNQVKRTLSIADQRGSPFKKRQFTEQITPPAHTDDDDDDNDDDDSNTGAASSKATNGTKRDDNRRRAAHTAAEQKRRNAIRKGYDALQSLVPNSHLLDPISSQKVSKAAILKRSTDFLAQLNKEKEQLNHQLEAKKTDTICLRVLQKAYEDILDMNMNASKNASASVDDEQKFKVFQKISDALFRSFDEAMQAGQVSNFPQFTHTVLRWIEDSCRPTDISEIIRQATAN